jgi:hypothetical protein
MKQKNIVSSKGGRKPASHCSSKMKKTTKKIDDVSFLFQSLENCTRHLFGFLKVAGKVIYYLVALVLALLALFGFPSAL